jgi:hypothetical protein
MRAHFIACYTRILNQAWCDEEFCALLDADPRSALAANGLRVSPESRINVIRLPGDRPEIRMQLALWEDAGWTGNYVLHVPSVVIRELSDAELDGLAGGAGATCPCPWCARLC